MFLTIKRCPTCGSGGIRRVRRDWRGRFGSREYTVPALAFYECGACGEKVYDRDAMRKIEAHSPVFSRRRLRRSA